MFALIGSKGDRQTLEQINPSIGVDKEWFSRRINEMGYDVRKKQVDLLGFDSGDEYTQPNDWSSSGMFDMSQLQNVEPNAALGQADMFNISPSNFITTAATNVPLSGSSIG